MYKMLMFFPRCFFYAISLGGWNWFPKKRTALLPEHIFYVRCVPLFGIAMKPLLKGLTKVLGEGLEYTLTEIDGFRVGSCIGLSTPTYKTPEELVEYCQGACSEGWQVPQPRCIKAMVSQETLDAIEKSSVLKVFDTTEYTSQVYEYYVCYKSSKFLNAAIQVLIANGELEAECFECESDCLIDEEGDCKNCNTERISPSTLNSTIEKLQKEAA